MKCGHAFLRFHLLGLASLTATILLAASSHAQTIALTINEDGARRSTDIHWPANHTPLQADLFAHNETNIDASCKTVWQQIVAASQWSDWYPNAQEVRIADGDHRLRRHSRFTWTTFGLHVSSHVHEFVPYRRIGWFGTSTDLDAYHTWLLQPGGKACHVVTEEVVKGKGAVALRESDPQAMHNGHDLWLATLKKRAETR